MFGKFKDEEHNYWISYTDLVMGFLIIFIVMTLILYNRDSEKKVLEGKYQELESTFVEQFENVLGIEVTDDATIRFVINDPEKDTLFVSGEYKATAYTLGLLQEFIPIYFDEIYRLYTRQAEADEAGQLRIRELRIEGHTDSEGEYYTNLQFSSARAVKVQQLILTDEHFTSRYDSSFQEFVKLNTIACGYSYSRLLDRSGEFVRLSGQKEDKGKSRRVEFRVLLESQL